MESTPFSFYAYKYKCPVQFMYIIYKRNFLLYVFGRSWNFLRHPRVSYRNIYHCYVHLATDTFLPNVWWLVTNTKKISF